MRSVSPPGRGWGWVQCMLKKIEMGTSRVWFGVPPSGGTNCLDRLAKNER